MILRSADKQFSISPEGEIFFQPDASNPLPGIAVGKVSKGETLLRPKAIVTLPPETAAAIEGIESKLQEWLDKTLEAALEPLFRLTRGEDLKDAAKELADKLHDGLGILPREDMSAIIAKLDEDGRKALRARKVRMGPLLIFMPELNKPAAVKLRAFLLTLWNDKALPAQTPSDGMVSLSVADKDIDPVYYRSIGYPVYGPRAIRVDMLDRVVCAVYDAAKDGKFQAQHQMAEWLGSNVPDLYAVLEAMGHTKISDPQEEKIKADAAAPVAVAGEPKVEEPKAEDVPEEKPAEEAAPSAAEPAVAPKPVARPELATFKLKRGGAGSAARGPRAPRREKKKSGPKEPKVLWEKSKNPPKEKSDRPRKEGDRERKRFDKKDRPKDDGKERVFAAEAKEKYDSPFAILQQLKTGNDKK